MERLTKRFTDGTYYCEDIEDVGIKGINAPTYVGKVVDKLANYEDLEEQGLLLRLPCKVGDTVWDNDFGTPYAYEVTGFSYKNLNEDDEDDYGDEIVAYYKNFNDSITGRFAASEIGKTVFLTKEEAEQKLKELRGDQNETI